MHTYYVFDIVHAFFKHASINKCIYAYVYICIPMCALCVCMLECDADTYAYAFYEVGLYYITWLFLRSSCIFSSSQMGNRCEMSSFLQLGDVKKNAGKGSSQWYL